jgi:hypothetical protein
MTVRLPTLASLGWPKSPERGEACLWWCRVCAAMRVVRPEGRCRSCGMKEAWILRRQRREARA